MAKLLLLTQVTLGMPQFLFHVTMDIYWRVQAPSECEIIETYLNNMWIITGYYWYPAPPSCGNMPQYCFSHFENFLC